MIVIDIYFQLFSVIIFTLMVLVLIYYLVQINKINKEIKNSENIIQRILTELKQRLYNQDQKILDLDVKLNIAELRIGKFSNLIIEKNVNESKNMFNNKQTSEMISHMKPVSQKNNLLTITEKEIINNLSYKDCTASDLQVSINKTREHTSRLLNKLFNSGYITRDDSKKPYIYKLIKINDVTFV